MLEELISGEASNTMKEMHIMCCLYWLGLVTTMITSVIIIIASFHCQREHVSKRTFPIISNIPFNAFI